jgi:signal transduction histidine kinase/CheY-like chemotaxis protein
MRKFGHRIKIFYMNCIPSNAEQVMKVLRRSDYDFEIQRSMSPNDFYPKVAEFRPEIIIADHGIHSACLVEALETLKQNVNQIPVILITDFESEEFARMLTNTGVTDYVFIEKPERLPFAISSAVETHRTLTHCRNQSEQSRKEFSDLVEHLPVGLSIWNAQKQLVYFNRALNAFSYCEGEDNFLQHWKKITIDVYDQENSSFSLDKEMLSECIARGITISRDDLYILKEDGSKRFVNIVATPSVSTTGQVRGATLIFQDTTSQNVAAQKAKALFDLLQTKNNELSEFGYIISHNLRDPIAKILGLASICDADTDESRFIVKKITEEANKLDSVVKDLNVIISVRNVEKEKRESLTFDHEFSLVSQVLKREIQDSKAMIETDFEELNEVFTVKSYLYSVLYNLLSNSIKYRDISKPLSIKMRTYAIGQYACLSVRDNGLGIDLNKNREKVFGLYKRFHSENIPGKGVGLHFIKSYAEALGGKVEIDSKLDEGTELKVYFLNNQNHTNNHVPQ